VLPPAELGEPGDPRAEPVGTFLGMVVTRTPIPAPRTVAPPSPAADASAERSAVAPAIPAGRRSWRRAAAILGAGLVIAGGITVAILETRGDPAAIPASTAAAARRPDPGQSVMARANELAAQGDKDTALDLLSRARRQSPDSAGLAYTAGKIYFSKFYWTDGLKSFRDAIRSDPTYRSDPELIKIVLRGFLSTPGYNDDLANFLREDIGAAAQPLLEETARDHPNAALRARAATELRRYR
jgi:tetratricopeptide (TPR) repeat protein